MSRNRETTCATLSKVAPVWVGRLYSQVKRRHGWGADAMGYREEAMTAVRTRALELMSTVTFHEIGRDELEDFASKLAASVRVVLAEYPSIREFLVGADLESGDINFGLRFISVDPDYADDMADEVLAKAVDLVAEQGGSRPADLEREESVLLLTR